MGAIGRFRRHLDGGKDAQRENRHDVERRLGKLSKKQISRFDETSTHGTRAIQGDVYALRRLRWLSR